MSENDLLGSNMTISNDNFLNSLTAQTQSFNLKKEEQQINLNGSFQSLPINQDNNSNLMNLNMNGYFLSNSTNALNKPNIDSLDMFANSDFLHGGCDSTTTKSSPLHSFHEVSSPDSHNSKSNKQQFCTKQKLFESQENSGKKITFILFYHLEYLIYII